MLILDLSHVHTIKIFIFHKREEKLGCVIQNITKQAMKGAFDEEICLQLKKNGREDDYQKK